MGARSPRPSDVPSPPVTVTDGRGWVLTDTADDGAPPPRPTRALALLAAVAVGAAVVAGLDAEPPPPPPPVAADLHIDDEGIAVSGGGVMVVPVELVNHGPAVRVQRTTVSAVPTKSGATSNGEGYVGSGETGRRVVLFQPDCALLRVGFPVEVSVVMALRGAQGQQQEVRLDLAASPALVERVYRLCYPVT